MIDGGTGYPAYQWMPFNKSFFKECVELPKLYSYVVRYDTGFAPNPYYGYLTIACCKPQIRKTAEVGDWVIGGGSAGEGRGGKAVFVMQVSEILTREEYWNDPRFLAKRPWMNAGYTEAVGDNAYRPSDSTGELEQIPCQHSESDCTPCGDDMEADLSVNRVLIGKKFTYWGGDGPTIPTFAGEHLFFRRGHKSNYPDKVVSAAIDWYEKLPSQGVRGKPADKQAVVFPGRTAPEPPLD